MSKTQAATSAGVTWFELPATDTEKAQAFYGDLFGWEFERFGELDYHTTQQGGGAITGMADEKGLLAYFGVEAIDDAVARVRELGGESSDKHEIPGVGRYAHCTDPDGNRFGLFESGGGS